MRNYVSKIFTVLSLAVLALLAFTVSAHAADAVTPPGDSWLDLARPVFDAIKGGHYIAAAALALVLSVGLLKLYAKKIPKVGEWLDTAVHTDVGGTLTTFAMSFGGALATATMATGSGWSGLSLSVLKMSGLVGLTAIGGYVGIKKLLIPLLKKIAPKCPAWTQPLFAAVFWLFDKPDPVAEAEGAGNDAVAANPAPGSTKITGEPEKF